ncbi:MAG: hypothetical protein WCD86_17770 [Ktedonobacteraceae bacterium]
MFDEDVHSWPQKGDRLFTVDGDWRDFARLNSQRDNLSLYAVGYKLAGDKLVESVTMNQKNHDTLVFPIASLYRHYLELRLKQLIRDGSQILNTPLDFPKSHDFDSLWEQCKPILERIAPKALSIEADVVHQTLEAIGELLAEFAALDADSMAFRYPTDKHNKALLSNVSDINLRHLAETMNKMERFLEKIAWPVSVSAEQKRAMNSPIRDVCGTPSPNPMKSP